MEAPPLALRNCYMANFGHSVNSCQDERAGARTTLIPRRRFARVRRLRGALPAHTLQALLDAVIPIVVLLKRAFLSQEGGAVDVYLPGARNRHSRIFWPRTRAIHDIMLRIRLGSALTRADAPLLPHQPDRPLGTAAQLEQVFDLRCPVAKLRRG